MGSARRHSATIDSDMMYVAIPVSNPGMPLLSIVRLAVPLTDVDRQLAWVRTLALLGFATGIVAAIVLTWAFSVPLGRRLRSMQQRVEQYATGDLSRPAPDYGDDEIGTIARMLDRLAQDFAQRLAGLEADRARMEAILAGMIEGVLVVNEHGRLQLANDAARRMLRIDEAVEGRHYPEIVRQPAVARQIADALAGRPTESVELTGLRESAAILIARTAPVEGIPGSRRGRRAARHHRPAPRRSDPARLRRQRLARAAHAADRRSAATSRRSPTQTPRRAGDSWKSCRATRCAWSASCATCSDSRGSTPGRSCSSACRARSTACSRAVETDLSTVISTRRQTVRRDVDPDAATVQGDPAKLQDALRNLLENAINYSPEDSTDRDAGAAACGTHRDHGR